MAIDDCSRLAFAEICTDERQHTAATFLKAAVGYYAGLGITVKSIMTDNGACFISHTFARACAQLGLKHIFTRPYTPRTNGKAERFIQTSLREWAYHASYDHSGAALGALAPWLHHYNWHRPHYSLSLKPPASRLQLPPDTGQPLETSHLGRCAAHLHEFAGLEEVGRGLGKSISMVLMLPLTAIFAITP